MLELRGKRALVTGAGRRVGAEIAVELGRAGMQVAVHYASSAVGAEQTCARIRAAGGVAHALAADLRVRAAARELIDRTLAVLGGLDLLVLSAANYERVPLPSIDDRHWDEMLALNLTAPFVLAQHAAPALRAARGSIVFVTCIGRLAPYRDFLAYETSKAALYHLMRLLALELAPEVRVNAVAPGTVLPPSDWDEQRVAALAETIPLGRVGGAHDVADAVVHLACSEWTTGSEIVVDGGRSAS
jgi:pteridine reductase